MCYATDLSENLIGGERMQISLPIIYFGFDESTENTVQDAVQHALVKFHNAYINGSQVETLSRQTDRQTNKQTNKLRDRWRYARTGKRTYLMSA